jgi:hypothetical protein
MRARYALAALALLVVALVGSGCAVAQSTSAMLDVGYDFLAAMRDGNDTAAFDLCCPALQAQVGDAAGLRAHAEQFHFRPQRWMLQHWHVRQSGATATAHLVGHATLRDGEKADVALDLVQDAPGAAWRVTRFQVQ